MQATLQHWILQAASSGSLLPKGILIASCALPIALALISNRIVIMLGSLLAIAGCSLVVLEPRSATSIIAIGAYLGAILVAIGGIETRRTTNHSEVADLKFKLHEFELMLTKLQQAEERCRVVPKEQDLVLTRDDGTTRADGIAAARADLSEILPMLENMGAK